MKDNELDLKNNLLNLKFTTMFATERLYILSNGKVAALNKKDGSIVWEVNLKDYIKHVSYYMGQITEENGKLYIGISGRVLCLNAKDGSLVWKNELKGWGYNFVSIANTGSEADAAQEAANANAAIGVS